MIDRAILARFNPEGVMKPVQYLRAAADGWEWITDRENAYVFPSCAEAEKAVPAHVYTDADGKQHEPWPLVKDGLSPEAEKRRKDRIAAAEASLRDRPIATEEVYRRTAQRLGERE